MPNSNVKITSYFDALAFSRHNEGLVFDEENLEPEQLTRALENAGIDPRTMRVSKWCQEPAPKDDDSQSPSTTRVSDVVEVIIPDTRAIEIDEEGLAIRRGDMLPPVPKRVENPRI